MASLPTWVRNGARIALRSGNIQQALVILWGMHGSGVLPDDMIEMVDKLRDLNDTERQHGYYEDMPSWNQRWRDARAAVEEQAERIAARLDEMETVDDAS